MKNRSTLRRLGIACLIFFQASVPCIALAQGGRASAGPAGLVNSVTGNAYARDASGKEIPLKAGDVFSPGTIFRTGPDSNIVLLFADGQNIALDKDSELHVDAYRFDPRDAKLGVATIGLTSGLMRFVTGAIHSQNQDALFISAGKVSIDILSKDVTAFVVEADPKVAGVGELAVIVGEVAVQTPLGPPTIVAADQFTRWRTGAAPSAPAPLAAAPAIFQAAVAASRALVFGSNAPVDVQSAALQAALAALPATGAGPAQPQVQAQSVESIVAVITPAVTSGGGRGCVGSPC
jgi:hypothetical protein